MATTHKEQELDKERFAELRAAVATIRQHNREQGRPENAVSGHTSPDWLKKAVGLFAGSEAFEEAVQYGEKWRNAERPEKDEE